MKTFEEFKDEILKRAREANARKQEYGRAYKSNTFDELMLVIKDNFSFAVNKKVIDPELIEDYKEEFIASDIYCNQYTEKGYLLVSDFSMENINGNVVVNVRGNATIQNVRDNATIQDVWDNATIQNVRDNATIQDVWDNATIQNVRDNATIQNVRDNAYISSYYLIECKLHDNAILRIRKDNIIQYVSDDIKMDKLV